MQNPTLPPSPVGEESPCCPGIKNTSTIIIEIDVGREHGRCPSRAVINENKPQFVEKGIVREVS